LNLDDDSFRWLREIPTGQILTYSFRPEADVYAEEIDYGAVATTFTLRLPNQHLPVSATLLGDFNVYNMLAAATAAHALDIEGTAIKAGLEAVSGLSGRMERIDMGQPFLTVVDFAHTPHALERAIAAARRMVDGNGRIIAVFGSAGKRDVEKRRLMAEIAARDADLAVLTAEDPRTESLVQILEMMAEGCRSQGGIEGETFWRVPDRGRAIYHAVSLAQPRDLVLICGKGHEQSLCFGTTEYPWDDRDATRKALQALAEDMPMPDLGLPTF
jgi:UDP-N-acetylmuramoyl-L-alanyl-D-glutamate--2,6-diaminopimelate ligase